MNTIEFCELVENTLGWQPPDNVPRWKALQIEAGKLKKKIATDPRLYTWDNLQLAVELLRRERKPVASPAAVCWHVQRALRLAPVAARTDSVDERIAELIKVETQAGDPHGWVTRLARARGVGRERVLSDYELARKLGATS